MQPPVAALLNWVAKNELPTTNTLIGGTLILIALAIGFGIKSPHEDDVPHEDDTPQELTSN
jgi:drug/metabolite transporter (DMT)-like permease